jgi:hypothetical protein
VSVSCTGTYHLWCLCFTVYELWLYSLFCFLCSWIHMLIGFIVPFVRVNLLLF